MSQERTQPQQPGIFRVMLVVALGIAYLCLSHYANAVGAQKLGTVVALTPLLIASTSIAWHARYRNLYLGVIAGLLIALAWNWTRLLPYYGTLFWIEHAGTALMLAVMFGRTLRDGQVPLCTTFARMVHGTTTPEHENYARKLTKAWTIFFVSMATVSTLVFILLPLKSWSIFANFFTGPLIMSMFAIEYVVRKKVLPNIEHANILDGVKAFFNQSPS